MTICSRLRRENGLALDDELARGREAGRRELHEVDPGGPRPCRVRSDPAPQEGPLCGEAGGHPLHMNYPVGDVIAGAFAAFAIAAAAS